MRPTKADPVLGGWSLFTILYLVLACLTACQGAKKAEVAFILFDII